MKFLIIYFNIVCCAFSLSDGILKINQKIISDEIFEILREECEGMRENYAIESIKDFITPPIHLQYNDTHHTTDEESSFESLSSRSMRTVWALDLTDTFMSVDVFAKFMRELTPFLPFLKVLKLSTVSLNIDSFQYIEPHLRKSQFQYVDLCGTLLSNRHVIPILEKYKGEVDAAGKRLTLKLIFADITYYKKLHNDIQWPKEYQKKNILPTRWYREHEEYYKPGGLFRKIQRAKPLHILTGNSDSDSDQEEEIDELSQRHSSLSTSSEDLNGEFLTLCTENLRALSLNTDSIEE